ncbi:MAG: hypothetical protein OEP48_09050 [Betaproteobacteria bacterium]|nr:hypothetical protein [Betaproteobacteria bacterium]MDH3435929.1 hypothetical protein [Betaproteobacteria bacterium]
MNRPPDYLYALLPVVHRARDAERGYPLRALLRVIDEQVNVVEEDIAQLYENWFIETCADWVVPYIGDLIGYRPVHEAGGPGSVETRQGRSKNKILIPRREVANTLGYRRRKGTLALLEVLANDVAGWPARAVEFYRLLGWAQDINHLRVARGRTTSLFDGDALDLIDGPFERLAHTVDVRRVISHRTLGRFNIPSVGVFVWRLRPYSVTHAPTYCVEAEGPHCFTFSALGHDKRLHTRPERETEATHIAEEINLPTPIRRRALEERISIRPLKTRASATYYGEGKSLVVYAPDWPAKGAPQPVPRDLVVPADLTDWKYRAQRGELAVDTVLGRIVFPTGQLPKRGVWVTYHYAFSKDMGGGEYSRSLTEPIEFALYKVSKDHPGADVFDAINGALAKWRQDQKALGPEPAGELEKETWRADKARLNAAVIEIRDSAVYSEPLAIALEAGESLQIRAANRTRPVIRLLDYMTHRPDAFMVSGKRASRFKLDGLIVTGRGMQVTGPDRSDPEIFAQGDLCDVTVRHSTLVPGWGLECDCEPKRPNEPSLELLNTSAKIVIEHSIIGSIHVVADEVQTDPVEISINDSIVDATSVEREAIAAPNLPLAFARLTVMRSTVIGEVNTHAIAAAENSIFMSHVCVGRRQQGCIRFCYVVTPGSRTPRRYHCQPDLVIAALDEIEPPLTAAEKSALQAREAQRVRPRFNSRRYGNSAYLQLADDCAEEIRCGADDESEMGAFHDLFQPQRTANLRARLDEYTPAGMEAGILFAN